MSSELNQNNLYQPWNSSWFHRERHVRWATGATLPPQRSQGALRLTRQGSRHRLLGEREAQNGNAGQIHWDLHLSAEIKAEGKAFLNIATKRKYSSTFYCPALSGHDELSVFSMS